jgi:hypothetical protein
MAIHEPLQQPMQRPVQRWRCPAVLRLELLFLGAIGVAVALVFFPLWFAIPVAAVLAAVYGGAAVVGMSVVVDTGAGMLVFRLGIIVRRIRLTDVTAVLVDKAKISIARSTGGEISLKVWGNFWLHRLVRAPALATDIGHAIAGAVALANDDNAAATGVDNADRPSVRTRAVTSANARSALAAALLGGTGVVAIVAALLVRLHWHNAAMTVLAVILALALALAGLIYLLVALWILLTLRSARTA